MPVSSLENSAPVLSCYLRFVHDVVPTNGRYYKHVMIVNDDSSVISKWSFKLIDDPGVIIYDRHRFIIQATVQTFLQWGIEIGLDRAPFVVFVYFFTSFEHAKNC
jgi:hypothetical protein